MFIFQFKVSKAKNAILKEFTGTWQELEMYFPNAIIVNQIPVEEEELV